MALIMACGGPSAGISTRVNELAAYFEAHKGKNYSEVHVVNDKSLGIVKSDYIDRETEKRARGKQMSAIKRLLSPNNVVILDSMTYIKGFRYQLFCEAKQAKVTSCVLYIGTPTATAHEFNAKNPDPWPQDLLEALEFRFEEPNGMNRWDSPLFIIVPQDKLPAEEIFDSAINKTPKKPNAATQKQVSVGADYLQILNDTTSQIVREALDLHALSPGAEVSLRGFRVALPYSLTLPQLTRIRRNFVSLNKQSAMPEENIVQFFVQFLEKNWDVTS